MTGEANVAVAAANQDPGIFDMMRTRAGVIAGGIGMAAMALAGCSGSSGHKASERTVSESSTVAACDTLEFSNAAADATKYESTAFLPKGNVDSNDHVKSYVLGLFDKSGPLGGNADAASLALVEAAITEPAKDTKVFDPNRNIAEAFDRKMAEYNGTNGLEAAKQDCKDTDKVLMQVSGYKQGWAQKGDKVVQVTAIRDSQNRIVRVSLQNAPHGALEELSGDEMVLRDSTKGLDGFGDFLVDDKGNLYLKGVLKENQQSQNHEQQQSQSPTPTPSPVAGQKGEKAQNSSANNEQNNQSQSSSSQNQKSASSSSSISSSKTSTTSTGGSRTSTGSGTGTASGGTSTGTSGCGGSGTTCGGGSGSNTGATGTGTGTTGSTGTGTGTGTGTSGGETGGGSAPAPAPSPAPTETQPAPQPTPTETQPAPSPSPSQSTEAPKPTAPPTNPN